MIALLATYACGAATIGVLCVIADSQMVPGCEDAHAIDALESASRTSIVGTASVASGASPVVRRTVDVAENSNLRAEIKELRRQLDQREGMTGARLARARSNTDEAFALRVLETSELFPDAQALALANEVMSAEEMWGALDAEVVYFDQCFALRYAGPPSTAPWDERNNYRINTLVPEAKRRSIDLFQRLHELRVPPQLVQAFQTRVVEGL